MHYTICGTVRTIIKFTKTWQLDFAISINIQFFHTSNQIIKLFVSSVGESWPTNHFCSTTVFYGVLNLSFRKRRSILLWVVLLRRRRKIRLLWVSVMSYFRGDVFVLKPFRCDLFHILVEGFCYDWRHIGRQISTHR